MKQKIKITYECQQELTEEAIARINNNTAEQQKHELKVARLNLQNKLMSMLDGFDPTTIVIEVSLDE